MLKRLYADNYRSLVNFDCPLESRQLILGSNGSGKSSLFDILSIFRDVCGRGDFLNSKSVVSKLGEGSCTRWQNVSEQVFEFDITSPNGIYKSKFVIGNDNKSEDQTLKILEENITLDGFLLLERRGGNTRIFNETNKDWAELGFDFPKSISIVSLFDTKADTKLSWLKNWFKNLLIITPDPKRMTSLARRESLLPESDLSNFADWYRHIKLDLYDQEFVDDLSNILDGFSRLRFEEVGKRHRMLKVCFDQFDNGKTKKLCEYTLNELSDGQRVLIGLYALLHFAVKPGATVCFDEPDNFIALREVQPWLEKIYDRTGEAGDAQVLIASHHPELLNKMAFKEGLLLSRPHGRQTRLNPFTDPTKTGLSAAELLARGWEA